MAKVNRSTNKEMVTNPLKGGTYNTNVGKTPQPKVPKNGRTSGKK